MIYTLNCIDLKNEYPSKSFQMDFDPASLCDVHDVCWLTYGLKRILTLLVHNNVCRQRVAFPSACLHVTAAWVRPAIFLPRYLCGNCPLCPASFQHDNKDMLRQWDRHASVSTDKCKRSLNLLIRIPHVQLILWVLLDQLSCNYSSSYHSFNSGNAVAKSLSRRWSYCEKNCLKSFNSLGISNASECGVFTTSK